MSINRVTVTGNLTRDPELQATQGGTRVLRMGVAVNDRWRNPQTDQIGRASCRERVSSPV